MKRDLRAATSFSRIPVELHHHILCFADPEDVLALRKTCKYFLAITQEPRLWPSVYDRMRNTHALSCSPSEFAALATSQSERLLVRASRTEKLFGTFRSDIQHRITPAGQANKKGPLVALSFLSERFVLSVDRTTVVYVWDISKLASFPGAPSFPCARLTLCNWHFVTYSMSTDHSTFYIVLSKDARAHIFSLSLPLSAPDTDDTTLSFRDIAYVDTRFKKICAIDTDLCLVLLELSPSTIEVVDWGTQSRSSIVLSQEMVEEGGSQNHILTLRICGPYILCFRHRSVDAYPIPLEFSKPELLATKRPLPVLCQGLPVVGFTTRISLSHVRCSRSPSGDVYSICALTEDREYGMSHYVVHLRTTPEPSLSLRVLSSNGRHIERPISSLNLGTTGLRGVWVLEPNTSGDHHVVTFTIHPSRCPFDPERVQEECSPFDAQLVSVVSSNSGDDVTKCAVSEFTGRIALGSWVGTIMLL